MTISPEWSAEKKTYEEIRNQSISNEGNEYDVKPGRFDGYDYVEINIFGYNDDVSFYLFNKEEIDNCIRKLQESAKIFDATHQAIPPIQPISVPEETTLQIADKIRNETDEGKLNILRVQFLLRYLSTYHTAPDKETLIHDVLYGLGVAIDPDGYAMSKGFDEFKRLLKDNHLNL